MFWSHQNLDALCGSKSGLVFLDWCDGAGAGEVGEGGGGKSFCKCLIILQSIYTNAGYIQMQVIYKSRLYTKAGYIQKWHIYTKNRIYT